MCRSIPCTREASVEVHALLPKDSPKLKVNAFLMQRFIFLFQKLVLNVRLIFFCSGNGTNLIFLTGIYFKISLA